MLLPPTDRSILARRDAIVAALKAIVPDGVVADPSGLATFDADALSAYHQMPLVCVLPSTRDEVGAILKYAEAEGIPIVPRGAGTSLSGGALPREDGILIGMGRMKRILEIDYENGCVVVEPGVTNMNITRAVEAQGFYYAPDPSSQIACTIGGNVAENSGGLHCLKYGLTTNNLLGVTMVLPGGETVTLGGKSGAQGGLDLLGLVTGSEGLLGVVVEVIVKILRKAPVTRTLMASFDTVPAAGRCVAQIIAGGVVPAAMEFMDRPAAEAIEAFNQPGYPAGAEAILIIDVDGVEADVSHNMGRVIQIVADCGGRTVEATDEKQRARIWSGRKAAFAAMGRIAPDMICMDGTIPRHALPQVLEEMAGLSEKYGLGFCNVFHAGDGNLHPLILFDVMKEGEFERAEAFGADILRLCVKVGGVLTGEHGVGIEKRDLMTDMFSEADLEQQHRVKCAFDSGGLFNPGKVFPTLSVCIEQGHIHAHGGKLPHPHLPRY
ncbi:MAG: FAD-binding oxidoreductase [Alphaproteobacteria bacterium 64-11]|nr:FAD-binding protein [Alphaproteobacteria bacterium]OJU14040.1 MAG: FAD-binding oxidoreductase [Alphaproteobacteria bacterium 64-11]